MSHKEETPAKPRSASQTFVLWIAQGFGIGRVPKAPGTWGSVIGLAWFALLLWIGGHQPALAGFILVASILASVWVCEAGEKILGQKDPGSIVIDEIVAACTRAETGARNIDAIIDRTLAPEISSKLLAFMTENKSPTKLTISKAKDGGFKYKFI